MGGTGTLDTAAGWSPQGVPGSGDTAVIGTGANVIVPSRTVLAAPLVLADSGASLTVAGPVTLVSLAGQPGLLATGPGTTITGIGATTTGNVVNSPGGTTAGPSHPYLDGGLAVAGSPDPSRPVVFQSTGGQFTLFDTLDVTGTVVLAGSGTGSSAPAVVSIGAVNVEPGGDLVLQGGSTVLGSVHVASGTLDASPAFFAPGVTFDDNAGKLVLHNGETADVTNFRTGDTINVKGISVSGRLQPDGYGYYVVGTAAVKFEGQSASGAIYTATPDGAGGTLVTASGGAAASRATPAQYVFGFAFSDAAVQSLPGNRTLLTAPNGIVTDVTGVGTLQFTDGMIQEHSDATGGEPLVDPLYYYARNLDVWAAHVATGLDAGQHYAQFGWREGRDPDALFSTRTYLAANPDVAQAGVDPAQHYDQFGWKEGRAGVPGFSVEAYRAANPDVFRAGIDPLQHALAFGEAEGRYAFAGLDAKGLVGDFDPQFYLSHNPDVAAAVPAGQSATQVALQHYLQYGYKEGRDPDALFSTNYYLVHNPDVAQTGTNALLHYEQYGWREGRDPGPNFGTDAYLNRNADVAAARTDPLQHYLEYGMAEGRQPT